jgi:hypothetical protein
MFFLTYFDAVAVMRFNTYAAITSTILEQTLVAQKIICAIRPPLFQIGEFDEDFLRSDAESAFRGANDLKHLDLWARPWAICPSPEVHLSQAQGGGTANVLALTMEECLPCPHPDVPVAEILSFREEFRAELQAFRGAIDDLYFAIARGSEEEARYVLQRQLLESVRDAQAASANAGPKAFMVGLKVLLNIGTAGAAAWFMQRYGEFASAAAGSAVSLAMEHSPLKISANKDPRDFAYVTRGLRRGLLRARPDLLNPPFDIENWRLAHSTLRSIDPNERVRLSRIRGGASEHNFM